jgi:hypothetical protein
VVADEPMHEQDRRRGRVHAVMEEATLFGTKAAEIVTAMPSGDTSSLTTIRADSTTCAVVARALRDAGMEVIFTGCIRRWSRFVATAIAEDANALELSVLSGAHMTLFANWRLLAPSNGDSERRPAIPRHWDAVVRHD